jgi:hypothetical protein
VERDDIPFANIPTRNPAEIKSHLITKPVEWTALYKEIK